MPRNVQPTVRMVPNSSFVRGRGRESTAEKNMFTSRRVCRDRACVQQQSASLASTALDFHPSTGCSSVYGVASLLDERHLPHD